MKRTTLICIVTLAATFGFTACGDKDKEDEDTGTVEDTTVEDTGTEDTGEEDTGAEDTGEEDTGAEDTGIEDTGTDDTGADDTGVDDTGSDDTGVADTGQDTSTDTGMDTGSTNDTSAPRFEEVNCGSASPAAQVAVGPMLKYNPANATVSKGEVVQWNFATGPHNVTADDDADCANNKSGWFQSMNLSTGDSYCVRFNKTGTWNYHCTVGSHCSAGMKGTVTVN